jgi:cytochrome c oxidase assembly protein subunit 11
MNPVPAPVARSRQRNIIEMAVLTAAMFGFGFGFAPLYSALCQLTNLNGRDNGMLVASSAAERPDSSRTVTLQLLTTVNGGREWDFKPEVTQIQVHPGQFYTINFVATNALADAVVGQAVPAVTPNKAAKHLKKSECFCFTQQVFKANERKVMPVRLMLDPELPKDIETVTLSYTLFDVTALAHEAAKSAKPQG